MVKDIFKYYKQYLVYLKLCKEFNKWSFGDLGQYNLKTEYAKADSSNQVVRLADDRAVTINKVFRCSVLNDAGEYIRIPNCQINTKITHTENYGSNK